ncbi:sulfite exporter TauE/SafE family protein [Candidatus Pacearchaeota archaeon]|nr:sulfite exporter TauE/SafE family protein [Candidatus Pacearchaeota archaeon]
MSFMAFMETMGTSSFPIVAAFFIGLMTAISPCPLATNITAIAYVSKKMSNSKHTLLIGFLYTLGKMFTYVGLASLIVFFGMQTQAISLFLQKYGEKILGPLLLIIGILMLDILKLHFFKSSNKLNKLKEKLAEKGFLGAFLLGVIFALAFCPFSAMLFFGMLIPLALRMGDGLIIPGVFALATGLPVIISSIILTKSVSKLGLIINKVQKLELWMRRIVAVIFILVGLYYTLRVF